MVVSSVQMPSSLQAPTKLVPLSERRSLAGPRMAKHLLRALMELSVVMDSMSDSSGRHAGKNHCPALIKLNAKTTHY